MLRNPKTLHIPTVPVIFNIDFQGNGLPGFTPSTSVLDVVNQMGPEIAGTFAGELSLRPG